MTRQRSSVPVTRIILDDDTQPPDTWHIHDTLTGLHRPNGETWTPCTMYLIEIPEDPA